MAEVYQDLFGEPAKVQVVHAGLECSVILSHCPNMDVVSFGPTLESPHTPNERCFIPSVDKYWRFGTRNLGTHAQEVKAPDFFIHCAPLLCDEQRGVFVPART